MRASVLLCCVVVVAVAFASCVSAQWCLDENGNNVDWFVAIKVPRLYDSNDPSVYSGVAYLYGDARSYQTPGSFWTNSTNDITSASSSVGATLQQIYDNSANSDNGYVMYNDETPAGVTSYTYGHSKGMLAWSKSSSFWLIHSVPKLADSPQNVNAYAYPSSGEEYGQSFLCLSIGLESVDQAFLQFQYTNPQVYGSQWVSSLASQLPNGNAFLNNGQTVQTASSNVGNITTVGGVQFTHFAKTVAWNQSIYGDLIGPYYNTDMVVETWQRPYEQPLTPPTVQESVYSVLDLQAPDYAAWDGVTWKESEDHAKWGMSPSDSNPLLCIGDINKQLTQWQRSGGMACIVDSVLHSVYKGLVVDTDEPNEEEEEAEEVDEDVPAFTDDAEIDAAAPADDAAEEQQEEQEALADVLGNVAQA